MVSKVWCTISIYVDDVKNILHSPHQQEYEKALAARRKVWDAAFEEYFMAEIHPDVCHSIGRWVLEEFNVYTIRTVE